jgi:hypothetical protein
MSRRSLREPPTDLFRALLQFAAWTVEEGGRGEVFLERDRAHDGSPETAKWARRAQRGAFPARDETYTKGSAG